MIYFSYFYTKTYVVGTLLEVPHQGASNEYQQHILVEKIFFDIFFFFISQRKHML